MKLLFILGYGVCLFVVFLPAEAGIVSLSNLQRVAEEEKPTEWLDRHGHNKAWWMNQIKTWKDKRASAHEALQKSEAAFKSTRFKNISATQKRIRRRKLSKEIQIHREDLQKAEAMLRSTLPEQARKAGVPSGWFR